jgi:hypothetical protein
MNYFSLVLLTKGFSPLFAPLSVHSGKFRKDELYHYIYIKRVFLAKDKTMVGAATSSPDMGSTQLNILGLSSGQSNNDSMK